MMRAIARQLWKHRLLAVAVAVVPCGVILGTARRVLPFAEEPITFTPRWSADLWDDEVSTIHLDAVYAMAIAAGFASKDAETIMIWNQLVDSTKLGPGDAAVYTNCLGSFAPPPDRDKVCDDYGVTGRQVWPTEKDRRCATSRFGAYSAFFHWPHQTRKELGRVRKWGWGQTKTLRGYGVYAWGDSLNVFGAECLYMREEVIDTGIKAGTLEAFATYLHVLADSYSHRDCLDALARQSPPFPWGNHTLSPDHIPECYYLPPYPHNGDAHGEEFGSGAGTGRTDEALLAVYGELVARSVRREGKYVPLALDDVLAPMEGQPTLRQALHDFVHNWEFQNEAPGADRAEFAADRRAYAEQIATAAKAMRKRARRGRD